MFGNKNGFSLEA